MFAGRSNGFSLLDAANSQPAARISGSARRLIRAPLDPGRAHRGASAVRARGAAVTGAMASKRVASLWRPSLGLRFAPGAEPASSPPPPEASRFVHTSSGPARSAEEHVDAPEGDAAPDHGLGTQAAPLAVDAVGGDVALGMEAPGRARGPIEEDQAGALQRGDARQPSPSFAMSSELFRAAKEAVPGTAESFWTYRLYQRTTEQGAVERVKVHYCTSKKTTEDVCRRHFLGHDVLGFDLEWSCYAFNGSGPRHNVSLIQLASPSRIGLFHVAVFADDDLVAPTLRRIMEDPGVRKVGVNILGDRTRLKKHLGVEARAVFELSHLYKLVKHSAAGTPRLINKAIVSLATQVEEHLQLPLYKGDSVRSSNWLHPLSLDQILYSASDAYAGVELYRILEAKRKELTPCPPRPHHAELGLPIPLTETSIPIPRATARRPPTTPPATEPRLPTPHAGPRLPLHALASTPAPDARDARVVDADRRASEFRSSGSTLVAAAALRAYFVWHGNADLDPESVARLLRDPPLKTSTVVTYILRAVAGGNLPYSRARLRTEVLASLHSSAARGMYRSLVEDCGCELRPDAPGVQDG